MRLIDELYTKRPLYGIRRITKGLKRLGRCINHKRVARLMREVGMKGRVVKVTRRMPGFRRFMGQGENLRLKRPDAKKLNDTWVADVTYLKVQGKWLYLAVIMDIHSRRILGWSLSKTRTAQLTMRVLRQASQDRKPKIFHTDRGIEYTGHRFQEQLKKLGLKSSLNRAGHCTDNAHMESFFHSMKAELIRGRRFQKEKDLRMALKS